jgi:hypothetical protein
MSTTTCYSGSCSSHSSRQMSLYSILLSGIYSFILNNVSNVCVSHFGTKLANFLQLSGSIAQSSVTVIIFGVAAVLLVKRLLKV